MLPWPFRFSHVDASASSNCARTRVTFVLAVSPAQQQWFFLLGRGVGPPINSGCEWMPFSISRRVRRESKRWVQDTGEMFFFFFFFFFFFGGGGEREHGKGIHHQPHLEISAVGLFAAVRGQQPSSPGLPVTARSKAAVSAWVSVLRAHTDTETYRETHKGRGKRHMPHSLKAQTSKPVAVMEASDPYSITAIPAACFTNEPLLAVARVVKEAKEKEGQNMGRVPCFDRGSRPCSLMLRTRRRRQRSIQRAAARVTSTGWRDTQDEP